MKKILCTFMALVMFYAYTGLTSAVYAIQEPAKAPAKTAQSKKTVQFAFVFDGPSDKNEEVLKTFQKTIIKSLAPEYKTVFPKELVFTGNWTKQSAINASEKALKSKAFMVISLGYMSSVHLASIKNPSKYVVTIDEYGLRDLGSDAFFNPVKAAANDFVLFKKLVPNQEKIAILINENFYNGRKDWNGLVKIKLDEKKLDMNFVVLPVSAKNLQGSLSKIPSNVDSVFVTPMFNLSTAQRKEMYEYFNSKKLPSFSSLGAEDVKLGALLGTSTPDVDRKLAEATSFNIYGVLQGKAVKNEKLPYYDNDVIFYNKDTGKELGYNAPLRLLNNAEIISNKEVTKYDLTYVFNKLEESNLDIARKKYLVSAARRATTAAYLRYLPTARVNLGYQTYNSDYANSYSSTPTRAGQLVFGIDQVIYSPDLVTNIIVKHKKLKFDKAEKVLTEQNMGLEVANLYMDTLILENIIKVQEEFVKETRENLAIAQVRAKSGFCGKEEVLQWTSQVSEAEKKLLALRADYNNIKIQINKLLYKDQKEEFTFAPLTAHDPAFFTSGINIIDHVRTPDKLEKFTDLLIKEVIYLSPETTKLKAAIAMKKAEMGNYAQKFILPTAMLSYEYGTQFDRHIPYEQEGHLQMAQTYAQTQGAMGTPWLNLDKTYGRFFVGATWKPIEGGHKIAEIARCKAELNELKAYLEEVNTELEMTVREVVNRAIAKYFIIEKSYKAMFAAAENYQTVKAKYLIGQAPISQLSEAQHLSTQAKIDALNSQYNFFKELIWVQRGLVSVNWTKASQKAKDFIGKVPEHFPAEEDFSL